MKEQNQKIIFLVSLESNTGTDRVVAKLERDMKSAGLNVTLVTPQATVLGCLPVSLRRVFKNVPGKRWVATFLIEFYLYYLSLKNTKQEMVVVTFVYPLFGIGAVINRIFRGYQYFYWIPDMIYRKSYVRDFRWALFTGFSKIGIRLSDKILVPSASAHLDILTFCNSKTIRKISRLDGVVDTEYLDGLIPDPIDFLRDKTFIFHPAGNKPSKNTARAIQAFESLNRSDVTFVSLINDVNSVTGTGPEKDAIGHFRLKDISDEQMKWLYCNCTVVSVVSVEEGIGLPILEAAYFRRPLVVSLISAMPEAASCNAVFVNPFDIREIASGYCIALDGLTTPYHCGGVVYGRDLPNQIDSLFKN
jgi:glycosyltransferase involved in cell wall biosynthesis